jgi:hypothetical protein
MDEGVVSIKNWPMDNLKEINHSTNVGNNGEL